MANMHHLTADTTHTVNYTMCLWCGIPTDGVAKPTDGMAKVTPKIAKLTTIQVGGIVISPNIKFTF